MIKSAGNDIVDLATINIERTKDERFYKKFITGTEIALYSQPQLAHLPFECFVWMLWTVKESVYKFIQRHDPGLVFSPSKIIVEQIAPPVAHVLSLAALSITEAQNFDAQTCYSCAVTFGSDTLYARSVINTSYIFTAVNNSANFKNIYHGVKLIADSAPETQSATVRQFILGKLDQVLKTRGLSIIKKPSGCPVLQQYHQEINIPVSLAHHGHYVAYTFLFEG